MTALYLQAALVVAISLAAFLLVTKAAWPANRMLFKAFAAWCRSLPDAWRRMRDPAYRKRRELVENYGGTFGGLLQLRAQRAGYERQRSEAGDFGIRFIDAMVADLDAKIEGMQLIAVELMRGLDADGVAAIAEDLNAKAFAGRAPDDALRSFLEEERELIVRSPHFAVDHVKRLILRFKAYAPDAPRSEDSSAPTP